MQNQSFYHNITTTVGSQTTNRFKQYANINRKLAHNIPQRVFLLKCRKSKLIPGFIQHFSKKCLNVFHQKNSLRCKLKNVLNNFHMKILNLIITDKCRTIKYLKSKLSTLEEQIKIDYRSTNFIDRQRVFKKNTIDKFKAINFKKFNELKCRALQENGFDKVVHKAWFENMSKVHIPADICWLLSLGQKFSLPVSKKEFPLFKLIADIENVLVCVKEDEEREEDQRLHICLIKLGM